MPPAMGAKDGVRRTGSIRNVVHAAADMRTRCMKATLAAIVVFLASYWPAVALDLICRSVAERQYPPIRTFELDAEGVREVICAGMTCYPRDYTVETRSPVLIEFSFEDNRDRVYISLDLDSRKMRIWSERKGPALDSGPPATQYAEYACRHMD